MRITCLAIFFTAYYEQSCSLGPAYKERGLPRQAGYPSTHPFPLFFFVVFSRQLGLPYLGARVTLAGR